jgi:DNA-binding NtrC family response regulator
MARDAQRKTLLTISVDPTLESSINDNLVLEGFRLLRARTQADALAIIEREAIDIILLDMENGAVQEIDLIHYTRTRHPTTEIIVFTTVRELEEARAALRNGASFYLIKPVSFVDLKRVLIKLSAQIEERREHQQLEQQFLSDLMAGSSAMEKMLRLALKIAPTSSTVLLGGESGTGKEFFARIIHRMSRRAEDRFVAMNCGAVPDSLFESELFGHRKGSFTGADRDKPGLVEEAQMGTLFLDEVGELSPSAQVKLLRFLQERSFRRVGETATRTVNVRIIAATNRDLYRMVQEGSFREDLFYRLNVFYLYLPPLRERRETIPSLLKLFIHRYATLMDKQITSLSKGAEVALANYDYQGNVRELENIVEHAVVLADGHEIDERDLPEFMFRYRKLLPAPAQDGLGGSCADEQLCTLEQLEQHHIEYALKKLDYNYSETARQLGISRSTLWRKIRHYQLQTPDDGGERVEG